ncbi:MAG TPA: phosphatase PAP2 family protein [Ktedonobacterales bacterium]|nr:phosphatase PAP2 family protein [Ktedonobacterales bacterium]
MPDVLQQAMQQFAAQNIFLGDLTIFCAEYLVFVLAALWLVVVAISFRAVSVAFIVRAVLLAGVSFALSLVLTRLINDPRPYLVEHLKTTLVPISTDNGFPSDHVLLASFLMISLWWIRRRYIPFFVVGMVLVALARLGIAAHHTLDVAGSLVIVLVVAVIIGFIPLPKSWRRPFLGRSNTQARQQ